MREVSDNSDSTIAAKEHQNSKKRKMQEEMIRREKERKRESQEGIGVLKLGDLIKHQKHHLAPVLKPLKRKSFEERFIELSKFKAKNGHCNPPSTPGSEYKSLGKWCSNLRCYHSQIQEGKSPRGSLTQHQIGRLEIMGFEWVRNISKFDSRLAELAEYKKKYGHCNPPVDHTGIKHKTLHHWCIQVQYSYKQMQAGKIPKRPLSLDQVRKLQMLGFNLERKDRKPV